MKIALFPSAFYPSLGGVEELTRQLALAHQKAGHDVLVITERWPRSIPAEEYYEGIKVVRFPMRVPAGSWKSNISFAISHHHIRTSIARIVRNFRADVLHAQCVSSTTFYALHVKKRLGIPLLVTLQGELTMDAAGIFQKKGIARHIMRRALGESDFVSACSSHTMEEAQHFFCSSLAYKSKVVPNGIDPTDFTAAIPHKHSRPYILAIGRHVPQKGFDVLLQAFAAAGDTGHDLLLAGDGDETQPLRHLAASLNLEQRVHFVGRANRDSVAALFKGCSFFVLPSRHEPLGIVNLEAMAAGKAVIATRVGGVPEIVHDGVNGILIAPEDVSEMAATIRRLATDRQLAIALGQAGESIAKDYDWNVLASTYREIYGQMMNSKKEGDHQPTQLTAFSAR